MSLLRTLDRRLAAVLGLLLTLVGVVGVVSTLLTTRHHLVEAEQKLNWTLAAQLVQESALLEHGVIEEANLDRVLHMLKVINPNNEIYILDAEGSILHTSSMTPPVRDAVDLEPVRRFLATRGRPLVLGDDPLMAEGRRTFSAARIPGDGERSQGYLYVVLAGSGERSLTEALRGSSILRLGASVVLSFLALSLVAGWVLLRLLTRRLRRLDRAMREFSNSGFAQVPAREERDVGGQRDDLERLDRTFHRMAERIVEQMEETQRADRLRRELVANVSHDLRTPLASLQGYLETLRLKDDSLSADDRRRYLDIALSQSQRLAHLVSELFDLAKLDAGEVAIELEPAP
ncbi:MAG: sensor histidine kinase, partial [Acidobacteria bacterium]|nr:sensor histidine kinase [Acidobacteriota bacterium]